MRYFIFICLVNTCFSQNVNFGLKFNPALCLTQVTKESNINTTNFKVLNYKLGYQIGLIGSIKLDPIIFDLQCLLSNKKTGLKFNGYQNDYLLNEYSTLSILNKLFVGYKIKTNLDPYYDIYIGPNFGYEFFRNFSRTGASSMAYFNDYQLNDSIIFNRSKFNGFTIGFALKINTELKKIGKISYGLSYDYLRSIYPEIDVKYKINNTQLKTIFIPRVSMLSFDLIYYFKSKKDNNWLV